MREDPVPWRPAGTAPRDGTVVAALFEGEADTAEPLMVRRWDAGWANIVGFHFGEVVPIDRWRHLTEEETTEMTGLFPSAMGTCERDALRGVDE